MSKEELENIALESTRTIDINEFVLKSDIDPQNYAELMSVMKVSINGSLTIRSQHVRVLDQENRMETFAITDEKQMRRCRYAQNRGS